MTTQVGLGLHHFQHWLAQGPQDEGSKGPSSSSAHAKGFQMLKLLPWSLQRLGLLKKQLKAFPTYAGKQSCKQRRTEIFFFTQIKSTTHVQHKKLMEYLLDFVKLEFFGGFFVCVYKALRTEKKIKDHRCIDFQAQKYWHCLSVLSTTFSSQKGH